MKKRFEEIERNMRSILEEVNKIPGNKYLCLEISLWPNHYLKPFQINLWDGKDHAPLNLPGYYGTFKDLITWLAKARRKEILFQKLNKIL